MLQMFNTEMQMMHTISKIKRFTSTIVKFEDTPHLLLNTDLRATSVASFLVLGGGARPPNVPTEKK